MELLIIRHGTAEPHGHPGGDGERALVDKGREQARGVGRFLKRVGCLPEVVLTSPLVRARQTADGLCAAAGIAAPVVQPWLACGMSPATAMDELDAYASFDCVAMVGHEPDLSELAGWLLGADAGRVRMKKGAVACISLRLPSRRGELQFLLPPKAMK
jgi:phosphohistidine phosphatase